MAIRSNLLLQSKAHKFKVTSAELYIFMVVLQQQNKRKITDLALKIWSAKYFTDLKITNVRTRMT